jgi:WD40 repeat protein
MFNKQNIKAYWLILCISCYFCSIATAQVGLSLIPIQDKVSFPVGTQEFQWACLANFELSEEENSNQGKIVYVDADRKGGVYAIDNNGYMYRFSVSDFSEKWKVKLSYEHLTDMAVSPDGKTIAICYNYIKTGSKKLEVRDAKDGQVLFKLKRVPDCYESSYFMDVMEYTTLYPSDLAYSSDGSKLAIWFKNHGFDENQCKSSLEEQLIIINPLTGAILASKREIPEDFGWTKCDQKHHFVFSPDDAYIYVSNCKAQIAQYKANNLELVRVVDFGQKINAIFTQQLDDKGSRRSNFPFHELVIQQNGDLITSIGRNGRIFRIEANLNDIHYLTQNQGSSNGHFSFSPDWSMAMFNSNHINLWDLNSQSPILQVETPNTFDAHTTRFHPTKRAIIVGTKRTLKIIAPCPISEVYINDEFTSTGHFVSAETGFSVRGKGKIYWAYGDNIIHQKNAKEDEISTEILGYSSLSNNTQNLPEPDELRLKTDQPGVYTIFGGSSKKMTSLEILDSLPNWQIAIYQH